VPEVFSLVVGPGGKAAMSVQEQEFVGSGQAQSYVGIFATTDNGLQWSANVTPCNVDVGPIPGWPNSALGNVETMALSPSGELWVVCNGQPAAGTMAAAVFVSDDEGTTWQQRYVGTAGDHTPALAVLSPDQALWTQGYSLAVTSDGGQTWSPEQALTGGGGPVIISTPSPDDLLVLIVGISLWHSTDRLHFTRIAGRNE